VSEPPFSWEAVARACDWSGREHVSLTETMLGRWRGKDAVALCFEAADSTQRAIGFGALAEAAARHASLLRRLGVGPGDRVAAIMPRVPEALVALLGVLHAGAIHVPIFSGFAPSAVASRVAAAGAKAVVTHATLASRLPVSWDPAVKVVAAGGDMPGAIPMEAALAAEPADMPAVPRRRQDPALLLFTSGSTGAPKGVQIAINFLAAVWPSFDHGIHLRPEDRFWPTGDPGWGWGLICYASALARGMAVHMWEANPTPETALDFILRHRITNLATVPTLLRGLMALGEEKLRVPGIALSKVSSCGEPLNGELVGFFRRVWSVTPLDQFGSSEHGLPIGNRYEEAERVRPGSMGRPYPGHRIAVLDEAGQEVPRGTVGLIASGPPPEGTYALGYWDNPEADAVLRRGEWLVTGDLGRQDDEGFLWFEGRSDDVIKSAGYRIGPFEVESALLTHPAVAEAGVVGKPDPARSQLVKAYVILRPGFEDSDELRKELAQTVRNTLGAHAFPREIEVVQELPKTNTGKIQRFVLRQRARDELS
jgi:acetyl-CoA synthetase